MQPIIRPSLLRAYRETSYETTCVTIRIGHRSLAMDRLLSSMAAREAVFVTAWNPYSRLMAPGWNRRMQTRLAESLRRHRVLPARGQWRRWSEDHILAFADARLIRKLSLRFRQNAIVIARRGQSTQLLLTTSYVGHAGFVRRGRQNPIMGDAAPGPIVVGSYKRRAPLLFTP